jgi:hypothetical protein
MPIADITEGFKLANETMALIEKLASAIEKLKPWIAAQPKAASAELADVLAEVMKAPAAVNEAIRNLLSLLDVGKMSLAELNALGSGVLSNEIELKRPHCQDVDAIAKRYLSPWLEPLAKEDANAEALKGLLRLLLYGDMDLFSQLTRFAEKIEELARALEKLVADNKQAEALRLLQDIAPRLIDVQSHANALAKQLSRMQTEFRGRALGVSTG